MNLKPTFSLAAPTVSLATFTQIVQAKATFSNCTSRSPTGFSPALVMDGISYNASSQQFTIV